MMGGTYLSRSIKQVTVLLYAMHMHGRYSWARGKSSRANPSHPLRTRAHKYIKGNRLFSTIARQEQMQAKSDGNIIF